MAPRELIRALRPQFWVLSIFPGFMGLFLSDRTVPLVDAVLIILLLSAISGIAELVNNYVDQDTDKFQRRKKIGGFVLSGGFEARITKKAMLLTTGALVLIAVGAAISINVYVLLLSFIGLVMAIGYSVKPLRFKSRGILGLIDMALGRGLVSFHIGWLTSSLPTVESLTIGVALSIMAFGTASLSHLADYIEDKHLNIGTYPVLVGFRKAAYHGAASLIMSLLVLLLANRMSLITLNILFFPLSLLGVILVYGMTTARAENAEDISKLQLLGILLVCLAPFVFI